MTPRTTRGRRHKPASAMLMIITLLSLVLAGRAEAATSPAIWVGSPVKGTWGVPGDTSTTPGCCPAHHMLVKASPANDWSVDLSSIPAGNDGVYLYAAPSDANLNNRVTARVTQIIDDNTCQVGGGGDMVTVGLYFDGVLKGRATYAHLARNPQLSIGMNIGRWGTWLGQVERNLPHNVQCWTGPHVHFELRAEREYSCWNKGLRTGYAIDRTNFLGFVSGPTAGVAQRCP